MIRHPNSQLFSMTSTSSEYKILLDQKVIILLYWFLFWALFCIQRRAFATCAVIEQGIRRDPLEFIKAPGSWLFFSHFSLHSYCSKRAKSLLLVLLKPGDLKPTEGFRHTHIQFLSMSTFNHCLSLCLVSFWIAVQERRVGHHVRWMHLIGRKSSLCELMAKLGVTWMNWVVLYLDAITD